MKKEEVASLVIYFLMIVAALIVGLTALPGLQQSCAPENLNPYLFTMIVIVVGVLVNVVGLEVLHLLGAKLGGYKVTSFNVFGFCTERKENKWVFHFRDFDGLTGETKIAPKKEKLNLRPYVWLPLFGFAAEIATCIVVYSVVGKQSNDFNAKWLQIASVLFILISSMLALYNLVPIKLDTMNDGYRLVLLSKPVNTEAYNELLRVEGLQREGKEVKDIKIFEEITEFTANLNLISVYNYLDEGKFKEADELIDLIIKEPKKVNQITYNRLVAQKLYINVLTKDVEEAKKIYDEIANDEIRRFIANDVSMESIRAYVLIAGIIEGSQGEIKFAASKLPKARKRSLPSRIKIEEKLYSQALEFVYKKHPKWEKENIAE